MRNSMYFNPQPDITLFELVTFMSRAGDLLVARYEGTLVSPEQWKSLGAMQRHWLLEETPVD